jgi:putative transcriptional regulator
MIRHHPPFDLLLDYVTGVSSEGMALAVAAHADRCFSCRTLIRDLESVGGALLEEIEAAPVGEDLLSAVLSRLDDPATAAPARASIDEATSNLIPRSLRRYVGGSFDDLPWRSVGRMFQEVRLPLAAKNIKASLMRLRPGSLMPRHTHRGHEVTLVLAGGYRDGVDQFGPGDFSAKDAADMHQPVVDDDGECVCLVVLDAPLKLTGAVGRLVNPFLRI